MPPLCKGRWILPQAKDGGIVVFQKLQSPSQLRCQPPLHKGPFILLGKYDRLPGAAQLPVLHGHGLAGDIVYIISILHRHFDLGALPLQREDAELFYFPVVAQADGNVVRVIRFRGEPVRRGEMLPPHGCDR